MTYDDDRMNDDRIVELDDDVLVLPDVSTDGSGSVWFERATSNDQRLIEERPPHWD